MAIQFVTILDPCLKSFEEAAVERYNNYLQMRQSVGCSPLPDEFEKQFTSALALDNFTFQATTSLLVGLNEIAQSDLVEEGIIKYEVDKHYKLPSRW